MLCAHTTLIYKGDWSSCRLGIGGFPGNPLGLPQMTLLKMPNARLTPDPLTQLAF